MMLLSVINGSAYLKKDNSLRKRSKCVKITRYIEQTLGKKSMVFQCAPCIKTYTWGCTRGCPLLTAGFEGAQPLSFTVALVWLLCGHRLRQFVGLGGSQRPCTAAPQLCTFCEHAVLANLVNPIKFSGWFSRIEGAVPQSGRGFARRKAVHWVELIMA